MHVERIAVHALCSGNLYFRGVSSIIMVELKGEVVWLAAGSICTANLPRCRDRAKLSNVCACIRGACERLSAGDRAEISEWADILTY